MCREANLIHHHLLLVSFFVGCEPLRYPSEGEHLTLEDVGLTARTAQEGLGDDGAVLVGQRVCPTLAVPGQPDAAVDCYESQPLDGATWVGDCFVVDEVGEVVWPLTPAASCPVAGYTAVADRFVLRGADPDDLEVAIDHWPEDYALSDQVRRFGAEDDLLPADGEPLRVLADTPTGFDLRFFDGIGPVAVRPADADWALPGGTTTTLDNGAVQLSLPAGASAVLDVGFDDQRYEVREVLGVAADEVVALELLAVTSVDGEHDTPLGARAIGRDAAGHPIFGLPVEWTLSRGYLAVRRGLYAGQDAYIGLADACVPPARRNGPHDALLTASWGDLSDQVALTWDAPPAEGDGLFVADPDCERGCGCAGSGPPTGLGAMLGLIALLRRRVTR